MALLTLGAAPVLSASQVALSDFSPGLTSMPVGEVVEQLTSAADPRQHYAAYLPSRYQRELKWPVLVLLDPRGRALLPLERIRPVAERLGYIVISSWNSRSDEPVDHNADAINAILTDADRMLAIDPHRIYLVGQSGTARGSWVFGNQLRENVAGIIGFGAGTPANFPLHPPRTGAASGPLFFGAAGTDDYNFEEMWNLDARLDSLGLPHHIGWFDGLHSWPPEPTLTEAVEWMHLQAMRTGLLAPDLGWIDRLYRSRLGSATRVAATGDDYRAWRLFRAIEADFTGTHDITAAQESRRELERHHGIFRAQRQMAELVRRQNEFNQRLGIVLGDLRTSAPPFTSAWRRLGLDDLVARSRDRADTMAAHAAQRALEQVWVYISFYEPREYLVRNDPARALAMLALAERLRPGDADVAHYRSEAFALQGQLPRNSAGR
jgi:predicted esterase